MDWNKLQSVAVKNNLGITAISFLLKNTTFVFHELNFRNPLFDHNSKTCKSWFNFCSISYIVWWLLEWTVISKFRLSLLIWKSLKRFFFIFIFNIRVHEWRRFHPVNQAKTKLYVKSDVQVHPDWNAISISRLPRMEGKDQTKVKIKLSAFAINIKKVKLRIKVKLTASYP